MTKKIRGLLSYFTKKERKKEVHREKEGELGSGCTIVIQIGLSQHMSKLDLSLGAKMQVAILQRQPHCIDKSDVAEFDPLLSFPYDLSVLS